VNVISTGAAIPLIEMLGRRPLILAAEGGMLASIAIITGALIAKSAQASLAAILGPIAIVGVMIFVTFFEVGLGAIPWSIGAEIFPGESRGAAMSFAAMVNWTATSVVGIVFPTFQKFLGNYSFIPFAAWLGIALIFTLAYVPETKGKEPQQLLNEINKGEVLSTAEDPKEESLLV
jgi:hypothetical protein